MSGLFDSNIGTSASNSQQTTTSTDGRVVGGDQSTNFSLNGNSAPVTINTTDAGAIHDSLALALAGIEGAYQAAGSASKTAAQVSTGAISAVQQGQAQFTSAIEQIKTGDKTTKVVVIGAVVAAVAIAYAMRKG